MGIERLDELEVGVAGVEVGEPDVRRFDLLRRVNRQPEPLVVEAKRLLGVANEHRDVVDPTQNRHDSAASAAAARRACSRQNTATPPRCASIAARAPRRRRAPSIARGSRACCSSVIGAEPGAEVLAADVDQRVADRVHQHEIELVVGRERDQAVELEVVARPQRRRRSPSLVIRSCTARTRDVLLRRRAPPPGPRCASRAAPAPRAPSRSRTRRRAGRGSSTR